MNNDNNGVREAETLDIKPPNLGRWFCRLDEDKDLEVSASASPTTGGAYIPLRIWNMAARGGDIVCPDTMNAINVIPFFIELWARFFLWESVRVVYLALYLTRYRIFFKYSRVFVETSLKYTTEAQLRYGKVPLTNILSNMSHHTTIPFLLTFEPRQYQSTPWFWLRGY